MSPLILYSVSISCFEGLLELLRDGGLVVVAEGYLLEFERRGYLKAGGFIPEVVLEHPHLVKVLHEEFVHAGSDVVEAFTVRLLMSWCFFLFYYFLGNVEQTASYVGTLAGMYIQCTSLQH